MYKHTHTYTHTYIHTHINILNLSCRRNGAHSKYVEEKELQPATMHFTRPEENEEAKYEEVKR